MKRFLAGTLKIVFTCLLISFGLANKVAAQDVAVSYQAFYDNLAPYGEWVYDARYGNVFVPYEDPGFRPYTRGHWVMTEYGNTWVSDDPWGWACYHYGRWTYNGYYGWIWIPGHEWAPAWVSWRYGGGYCGWAPLGPDYTVGGVYYCPDNWWVFVEPHYLYEPRWHEHWGGYERNNYYITRTEYVPYEGGGGHYNYGPRAEVIERDTHQQVVIYRTNSVNSSSATRVSGNSVSIYRPTIDRNSVNTARPANVIQAPHPIEARGEALPQHAETAPKPAFHQEHPVPQQNVQHGAPVRNNPEPQRNNGNNPAFQNHQAEPQRNNEQENNHQNNAPQRNFPQPEQHSNPAPARNEGNMQHGNNNVQPQRENNQNMNRQQPENNQRPAPRPMPQPARPAPQPARPNNVSNRKK